MLPAEGVEIAGLVGHQKVRLVFGTAQYQSLIQLPGCVPLGHCFIVAFDRVEAINALASVQSFWYFFSRGLSASKCTHFLLVRSYRGQPF